MPDPRRPGDPTPANAPPRPTGAVTGAVAEAPKPADARPAESAEPQYVDPNNPGAGVRVPKGRRARRMSETVEGGRYVVDAVYDDETGDVVRGRVVNANGDLIEEIGAEEEGEPAPTPRAEKK